MAADTPIGTRIARRRHVLGLTQQDLASALGVSKSTVANWETGKHFPRRYLGKVEAVLGIRLDPPGDEPEVPESLRRQVAALSPRQREWMIAWLRDEIRRQREEDRDHPQAAEV